GLPVSCSEGSELGVFDYIFADIGDAQSLENDLSTYSSHLLNLKKLLVLGDKSTLVLIDEFGAGTDPEYGGAIAEAILESLVEQKCKGVINTHYTNLKLLAQKQTGLVNAAMRFDPLKLEPLYELEIGKPGSSFALEIAKKIGLETKVIENAKSKIGKNRLEEDQLLIELEKKKAELEEQVKKIASKEKALKEATSQYEELRNLVSETKNKLINEAKSEAQQIIQNANKLIENTIREIKEHNAEKEKTQELRKTLDNELNKVKQEPKISNLPKLDISTLSVGDQVRIIGQEALGEVSALKGENVEVMWGELKTFVKISKLEKVSNRQLKKEQKTSPKPKLSGVDITEKMTNFRSEYDFRGLRADEALSALDQIMDDALLLGISEFKIVHGKGDGVLRQVLRKKLKEFKQVSGIKDEHPDRGGEGASIIIMK
ncbi:MAG: Smr/MutS family protein, partial [Cytophagales bacterium]